MQNNELLWLQVPTYLSLYSILFHYNFFASPLIKFFGISDWRKNVNFIEGFLVFCFVYYCFLCGCWRVISYIYLGKVIVGKVQL